MIDAKSKIFVSVNDYIGEVDINELTKFSKQEKVYVLSYNNYFKKFDYNKLENFKVGDITKKLIELKFISNIGKEYQLIVNEDQNIYTKVRGYIPALKVSYYYDVFMDINGNNCKLLSKKLLGVVDSKMIDFSVLYNNSAFVNGILIKDK